MKKEICLFFFVPSQGMDGWMWEEKKLTWHRCGHSAAVAQDHGTSDSSPTYSRGNVAKEKNEGEKKQKTKDEMTMNMENTGTMEPFTIE